MSFEPEAFAKDWIAAWNSHDLDAILSHYAADAVFFSPIARHVVGKGRVEGHEGLRAYWGKGLKLNPALAFVLDDVMRGDGCLTMLYRNERGRRVAETVEFDANGLIARAFACYGPST